MFKKIVAIVLLICGALIISYYEHNYTREDCKVVAVEDDVITFEDGCGLEWSAYAEGLQIGDKVSLKMNDNNTNSCVTDDKITDIIVE